VVNNTVTGDRIRHHVYTAASKEESHRGLRESGRWPQRQEFS
jgi:hypothetical protein